MNAIDRKSPGTPSDLASFHYGDGEFVVLNAGRFVTCAVTGTLIPLDALRYWSPDLQEAYATPADALARWRELNP